MAAELMWAIAVVVFALPFVLAWAFNDGNRADSRGRRIRARWHS